MPLVDLVDIVKNLVLMLASVTATVVGINGLHTWKRSLRGTEKFTRAKELLKAVFRVRNAFNHVRNPAIWGNEYPKEMVDVNGYLKAESEYEGYVHVYEQRWKVLAEAFRDLENEILLAEVEWGDEVNSLILPIRKCHVELKMAIQDHLEARKPGGFGHKTVSEEMKKGREKMYKVAGDAELDPFSPEIEAAVKRFEDRLRPVIRGDEKSSWWPLLL